LELPAPRGCHNEDYSTVIANFVFFGFGLFFAPTKAVLKMSIDEKVMKV
jgi:hypothetical protein